MGLGSRPPLGRVMPDYEERKKQLNVVTVQ
jgi:hypothetical protein